MDLHCVGIEVGLLGKLVGAGVTLKEALLVDDADVPIPVALVLEGECAIGAVA